MNGFSKDLHIQFCFLVLLVEILMATLYSSIEEFYKTMVPNSLITNKSVTFEFEV